jgi:2-methylcitrate dehydratase PrpD
VSQPLFEVLGEWVERVEFAAIPDAVQDVAKRAVLDCIGVTVAGVATPVAAIVDRYAAEADAGACSLIGRSRRCDMETAAFVNGAQGHALDFDDCTGSLGGHPSVVVLPAALAVAESRGASGAELLAAYVVGFEIAAKLGRAMNFVHYDRGWHPTATLGVFGATAAAAKLMRLDASTIATAFAIAASTAAGMKANFGTATKPLQVGRSAQNGVLASRLAGMGADANVGAFEHEQGFGQLFNGRGNYDAARATTALENPWDLLDPGLTVKQYPCCASTHGAVDAAMSLREQVTTPEAIKGVEVWTHPRRLRHTNRPVVTTGFEAKFSVQYVVARALQSGPVGLGDFSAQAIGDPAIASLMSRVDAKPLPEERWGADHFAAEVAVTLDSGRRLQARVERPRGNGPAEALTDVELQRKFDDCCRSAGLPAATRANIRDLLLSLERVDSLDEILAPLRVSEVRSPGHDQ